MLCKACKRFFPGLATYRTTLLSSQGLCLPLLFQVASTHLTAYRHPVSCLPAEYRNELRMLNQLPWSLFSIHRNQVVAQLQHSRGKLYPISTDRVIDLRESLPKRP